MVAIQQQQVLSTTAGELALEEYHLRIDEHGPWRLLHTGAILSHDDEQRFLTGEQPRVPHGIVIWPAAIALAHEIVLRPALFAGARVLELGAGVGLPGIVAASLGARVVVQTDKQEVALHVCKMNAKRNNLTSIIEHRAADWTEWRNDPERYDVILGSDILYAESMHPHLRQIVEANLTSTGTLLISDPFRKESITLLEAMESDGWRVTMSKWTVGTDATPRPVGVYELTRG